MGAYSSIPLEPPQNPLESYGKAVQLKSLMQQQQYQQQAQPLELEAKQQENQQRQMSLQDQKAQTDAMHDWDGKDVNALPGLILKHGGSAQAVFGTKQQILKYQTDTAQLSKDQLANEKIKNDYFAQAIDNVKALPPDQQPAAFEAAKADAVQKGHLDPQQAQGMTYQGPEQLDILEKSFMGHEAVLAAAQKAATEAETARHNKVSEQTQADRPETRTVVTGKGVFQYNPESNKFDKYIGPAPATAQFGNFGQAGDPMIDMVGQGRVDLATALQRVPPAAKQNFMTQLSAKYPDFNQATYGVEKAVTKDFTSGKSAQNLTAFNTAIEHAGQLDKAVDALKNGDVRGLNSIGNTLGYQFGSDATTNFNVIKNALSGEISKVFKGGQATDAEIQHVQQPFDAANSPAQLKGAIKQAIALMNSKRDALKQQYEAGRKAQPNFGKESGGTTVTDPRGGVHTFPDQASADAFKKAAGIK